MDIYSGFPLIALFANLFLCFYIIYIDPSKRLNQFFGLFTFFLAVWSFSNFFMFNSSSVSEAFFWNKIGTIGSAFTAVFVILFTLCFCKKDIPRI